MPPKNKASKNAFYYYMLEYKEKNPGKCHNMQQAAQFAGESWQKMSPNERKPYEMQAKANKNLQKVIKYTSTGKSIESVQKEQQEIFTNEQLMKDHISEMIHLSVEMGTIADEVFYVTHVNYFCYCNADKRYYPAEICIVRFTLRDGIADNNVFNQICNPGALPLGYLSVAKEISDTSHQIQPPVSPETDYNLPEVINSMWKFIIKTSGRTKGLPPIYATRKNLPIVENVFSNFADDTGYEHLKIYSLEYLFFILRNCCNDNKAWPASSLGELELQKDKYEFCPEISCDYHKNSDVPNYCSQSNVIRCIYTLCDNCSNDVGIKLIPGKHVPINANINAAESDSRATSALDSVDNESQFNDKDNGYLSRAESDYSVVSETSTVVDANDYAAVGGFDSEYSQADTDEWFEVKLKNKTASNSQGSAKQPLRRPTTLSAALTGRPNLGKGRGRGIAANFSGNR